MFSRPSSPFLTDLYQLTMAFGYWKTGRAQQKSLFHYFFRKNPFQGGFTLTAGLADVLELVTQFHFDTVELDYLSSLKGAKDLPLFEDGFLRHLETLRFSGDLWAMPEGTVCFPFEPMVRVEAPLLQAQLLETPLLNLMNFQSLIATKACRVCLATQGDPVFEFGLRRAQGPDGGVSASRAAFIGGCAGTSNVAAGFRFGIPVKGTHAHSWVMAFPDEPTAFSAYAEALPQNAVFLVDTYNTLEGVQHACEVGRELRQKGFSLSGIRLDSGDLTWLSQESRKILDAQGFPETRILAS
ncbi:MAG: nicotinate phosphoribosyltransferase, partial [Acidobacteria bacterium]|nr:nicotinate phosphoribosyltransferase [Acidobacteriota bacterium]